MVLPVFALNGELLEAAAVITAPHELTPARWQVLGAVLEEPLPVAKIARRVGLTRQSVQRVANDVVAQDWAHWQPNPGRRGQNLLVLTGKGRRAITALTAEQHAWADTIGQDIGGKNLKTQGTLLIRITNASRRYRYAAEESSRLKQETTPAAPDPERAPREPPVYNQIRNSRSWSTAKTSDIILDALGLADKGCVAGIDDAVGQ